MPKSSGHPTSRRTHWLGNRLYSPSLTVPVTGSFQTGLQMRCLCVDLSVVPKTIGSYPSLRSTYCTWSISYFTCSKSVYGSTWTITVFSSFKTVSKLHLTSWNLTQITLLTAVFEPQHAVLFEASPTEIPLLGLGILPHLEKSGVNLGLIDDMSVPSTAAWTLQVPSVRLDLATFKTDTTHPVMNKQFYLKLVYEYPDFWKIFTDGSESDEGVAVVTVTLKNYHMGYTCRLPNDSCIFTAELRAILLALWHIYHSKKKSFLVLSNSLSSLQVSHNMKYDHPIREKFTICTQVWSQMERRLFSSGSLVMQALVANQ